jgi:hypothetical protein
MQIALTAFVTILVGALTFVVGQIIIRGALEPALELKRLIGTIAHDIDFYANRFYYVSLKNKARGATYSENTHARFGKS